MTDRTISDKSVVKTAPVEVSPISTLPPGLDEGQYRPVDSEDRESDTVIELDMPEADEAGGYLLDTPTNVFIKSQTVRFLPGGETVVDVVITFDDVKGAKDYQTRMHTGADA